MPDAALRHAPSIADRLRQIVGNDHVLTDLEDRKFFSSDVYRPADELVECVLQPGSGEQLSEAVKVATAAGYVVIPRGGGYSYTDGYLAVRKNSILVDMRRLDRIVEINIEDMYVTVECGCTWEKLYTALKEKGVRTPYFGPLSGLRSVVGGALSQNSIFFGSGIHGTAVESCLGLEVVLADGRIIRTGSAATPHNPSPFFRTYGPDLTGVFLADTGALGFKVKATLRLIPFPPASLFASFAYENYEQIARAMSEISRQGLAAECFGFDPYLQGQRLKREGLLKDFQRLAGVARSGRSVLDGVKEAAKVAFHGRRMFEGVDYSMHIVVDGRDDATAESAMAAARKIATKEGREIENSLPKIMRAVPFVPPNSMLGPEGQRWIPIHAMVPHSRAPALLKAVHDYFDRHTEVVERHKIEWGYLLATVSYQTFLMEPVFFWEDERHLYHNRQLDPAYLGKLKAFPKNEAARRAVDELRRGLAKLFMEMGCTHFQIGKSYLYREGRDPETYKLLEAIKRHLDPAGLLNPGSLGLG
jgi:FAD/FMN-containing dehydrogenase